MAEPEVEGRGFTPRPGSDDWRALLDVPIEKLVVDGVQPLYVEGPAASAATRGGAQRIGVCMRADASTVLEEIAGGADALWLDARDGEASRLARARGIQVVTEIDLLDPPEGSADGEDDEVDRVAPLWLGFDPVASLLREPTYLAGWLGLVGKLAGDLSGHDKRTVRVSSLPYHAAGADAADELALMLATQVVYLRSLFEVGVDVKPGTELWFQIAVGRDTFGEVCKLRALRLLSHKVFAAAGIGDATAPIHAVCSSRAQSQRDPWVNMLRGTTEVFAAMLGGADLVTPLPFDSALGPASAHARRVARNTALVLREESHLGRVVDAAGGSYYIESRTDALAREAWSRFQAIERDGGIVALITSGKLRERMDAAWAARAASIAKRRVPVLGVSEFANLDEKPPTAADPATTTSFPAHRDGEGFEALRSRIEREPARLVALVTLGPASEHRARVGFASALFATAGLRTREMTLAEAVAAAPSIACICGSDERYATEAVAVARALGKLGAIEIVLAGRPGAIEADARAAGVSQFIYIGSDVLATLNELTS